MKGLKMKNISLVFLGMLLTGLAQAGISTKNGNFFIAYTDNAVFGAGKKLEFTRTYNSVSPDSGWLGIGWGTPFETYLKVFPDGSVVIFENGSGAKTRFTPQAGVDARVAAVKVVEAINKANMAQHKPILSGKEFDKMVDTLKNNEEMRRGYAQRLGVTTSLAKGSVLYSSKRGHQTLQVLDKGFKRLFTDGKVEVFSEAGKLISIQEKYGYRLDLSYDKSGFISSIKDSAAKQMFFETYSNGKIKSLWSAGDKKAEYKYSKTDDLIEASDVNGNVYKYTYDTDHNLVRIDYMDKSSMVIAYESKNLGSRRVVSVTDRNRETSKYTYGADPKDPQKHFWTEITRKSFDGKMVTDRYEYEMRTKDDGELYTYRNLTIIDGLKTDTTYTACCNLPERITQGNRTTWFKYNAKGLLEEKKSSTGELVQIAYDPKTEKIAKVVNNQGWTSFEYDTAGNLTKALNSKNQAVLLIYNKEGKVTKMVDQDASQNRRVLAFTYNALGKPIEIAMEGIGQINVEYNNEGEITNVSSKAATGLASTGIKSLEGSVGRKMASTNERMAEQVSSAFQNLMAIVKPAGVSLGL